MSKLGMLHFTAPADVGGTVNKPQESFIRSYIEMFAILCCRDKTRRDPSTSLFPLLYFVAATCIQCHCVKMSTMLPNSITLSTWKIVSTNFVHQSVEEHHGKFSYVC